MAVTRTFSIIKPDATRRNLTGAVTKMLEDARLAWKLLAGRDEVERRYWAQDGGRWAQKS